MARNNCHRMFVVALPLLIVACLSIPGCSKQAEGPEIITLEQAKIEKIDVGGSKLTVSYFSEKRDEWVSGVGMVTPETEIMINGVVAKLGDLKVGERIHGQVRVDKKNDKRIQTALKIYVDRPKPVGGSAGGS